MPQFPNTSETERFIKAESFKDMKIFVERSKYTGQCPEAGDEEGTRLQGHYTSFHLHSAELRVRWFLQNRALSPLVDEREVMRLLLLLHEHQLAELLALLDHVLLPHALFLCRLAFDHLSPF